MQMRSRFMLTGLTALLAAMVTFVPAAAQIARTFFEALHHPAIRYHDTSTNDPVERLNARLADGTATIAGDNPLDLLRSVLQALAVPVESQILVFSRTSLQAPRISTRTPRALFFNDQSAVAWVKGGLVEVAAQSPRHGTIFYLLHQTDSGGHRFERRTECLRCHHSYATGGVPGFLNRSVIPDQDGYPLRALSEVLISDMTPFEQRWGGRYVTGDAGDLHHRGNAIVTGSAGRTTPLDLPARHSGSSGDRLETDAALSSDSDVVALMVFDHQMHTLNLLTRLGWEVRAAAYDDRAPTIPQPEMVSDVVDALLFIDAAPLTAPVSSGSGYAERFEEPGPRDRRGRSLRELDLNNRLMRFPCSYLVYSEVFDALPADARRAIYERMWEVLSGRTEDPRHAQLSADDRQAVMEILRDTKPDLPATLP